MKEQNMNLFTIDKKCLHKYRVKKTKYKDSKVIPAIIYNTNPLTLIALAPLWTDDNYAIKRFGCQKFEIKELPFHVIREKERIPCCVEYFVSDNSSYYSNFKIYPLCFATENSNEIQNNIDLINKDNPSYFEILENLSSILPFNDLDILNFNLNILYILDENYKPLIFRNNDSESNMEYQLTQESKYYFKKNYDKIPNFKSKYPDIDKLINIAYKNQIAEYFLGFEGNPKKGYITPFNNQILIDNYVSSINPSLQTDEIILVVGFLIITNKGIWNEKGFISWNNVNIFIESTYDKDIYTRFNKKIFSDFRLCFDYYFVGSEQKKFSSILRSLEIEHFTNFWLDVKKYIGQNIPYDSNDNDLYHLTLKINNNLNINAYINLYEDIKIVLERLKKGFVEGGEKLLKEQDEDIKIEIYLYNKEDINILIKIINEIGLPKESLLITKERTIKL